MARSRDGVAFETVAELARDDFGAASVERPALVQRPDGGWRLFVSCATPGSSHWWVDAVDADDPSSFDAARRTTVLPGDAATGVKDPVVWCDEDGWHMWACCHPLAVAGEADRMVSRYATSREVTLPWSEEQAEEPSRLSTLVALTGSEGDVTCRIRRGAELLAEATCRRPPARLSCDYPPTGLPPVTYPPGL